VDNKQPSPGEWAMMTGAAVALLGSFLDFDFEQSAWGQGLFPVATLIAIYCVAVGVVVALRRFAGVDLPDRLAGFGWNQLFLALGVFAAVMSLFWLIAAEEAGPGLFLSLAGSVAVAVGAFLTVREQSPGTVG